MSSQEQQQRHVEEVVISSDEATPVYRPHSQLQPQELEEQEIELANPHDQNMTEQDRKKQEKIIKAMKELAEIEEQKRREEEANRQLLLRKKSKEQERQAEKHLRQEFKNHSFLPTRSLIAVKQKMSQFEIQCLMEELPHSQLPFSKPRQQNRKRLTRAMLLCIEQLRIKSLEQKTETQEQLLGPYFNSLLFCYKISKEIENIFYRRLRKQPNRNGDQYQKQIKLVLKEFNDKNNLEFRRDVLNRRVDYKELSQASEESLKCQKTKEEEKARMQQFVRESEKDPLAANNAAEPEEEAVTYGINSFASMPSFNNQMEAEDNLREGEEESKEKDKQHLHYLLEKCQHSMNRYLMQRQERTRLLLENHLRNPFFSQLCNKIGL